ncbi:MAG: PEP-CTERM sorting domain-containing protein [Cyanobacteria bacterium P01_C01_bin.118]
MFPQSFAWKRGLPVAFSLVLSLIATPAKAASLTLENFSFSEVSGDFTITGGETTPDAFRIFQDVTGPNIDLFTSIQGLRSSGFIGFRFESVLTNRTNTPWIFFDHELQEQFGVPSPEEDGLSFAQRIDRFRPFTSNTFSNVDEVTDVRDFVNFSGGVVNPNETVTFRYVILDNNPNDLFFLRQRPNFAPGGVGVVAVPPVAPPPTPVALPPPPPPVVPPAPVVPPSEPEPPAPTPPSVPDAIPDPVEQPVATVPEPGISLLGLIGLGLWLQRRR